ncbi:MAG: hypothetical protein WCW87_00660 [Candidatus Paceibacterota bacterium]
MDNNEKLNSSLSQNNPPTPTDKKNLSDDVGLLIMPKNISDINKTPKESPTVISPIITTPIKPILEDDRGLTIMPKNASEINNPPKESLKKVLSTPNIPISISPTPLGPAIPINNETEPNLKGEAVKEKQQEIRSALLGWVKGAKPTLPGAPKNTAIASSLDTKVNPNLKVIPQTPKPKEESVFQEKTQLGELVSKSTETQKEGVKSATNEISLPNKNPSIITNFKFEKAAQAYEEKVENMLVRPLRTYKEDLAKTIKEQNVSVVKIAAAESKKQQYQEKVEEEKSPSNPKNIIIIIFSIILIGGGLIDLYYIYNNFYKATEINQQVIKKTISTDFIKNIDITGLHDREFQDKILAEINKNNSALGSITSYQLIEKIAGQETLLSSQNFFAEVAPRMPSELSRALNSNFVFGIHTFDGNRPFIILNLNSYENVYSGMLSWEKNMTNDIERIFNLKNVDQNIGGFASSTTDEMAASQNHFTDILVQNKDVRLLKNKNNEEVILYSFFDNNHLVITTNEITMIKIFERLRVAQLER